MAESPEHDANDRLWRAQRVRQAVGNAFEAASVAEAECWHDLGMIDRAAGDWVHAELAFRRASELVRDLRVYPVVASLERYQHLLEEAQNMLKAGRHD